MDFFEAIQAGDVARVSELLERQPDLVNTRRDGGIAPVMLAIYAARSEMADLLLARGAELDIFVAAALGRLEHIKSLLAAGPDRELVNTKSADGWSPLHLASHFGQTEAVELLLAHGADVNARSENSMRNTPLHAALAGRHLRAAKLLLAGGADPNAQQHGGYTALQAAALHGDRDLLKLLLSMGANVSLRADNGQTALDMALQKGHSELAEVLRQSADSSV